MQIDPHMRPILERARQNPAPAYEALPIQDGRRIFEGLAAYWNTQDVPMHRIADVTIPAPGGAIPARLFVPEANAEEGPILVYAHGGGWTYGSIRTHERAVRVLARESGRRALSVDYRLAPEHPFPAAHDDLLAALRFIEDGGLGKTIPASRIALAGDSAGANIALGVLIARIRAGLPNLATAALCYGCFAPDFETASHRAFGNGSFILGSQRMRWYWQNYLGAEAFCTQSLAAPSRAPLADLSCLPPLYLNAAGLDCLRDDTFLLAERLAEAGAGFRFDLIPGVVHGFLQMSSELPAAKFAQIKIAAWLRENLGG